ncbi:hypothetical protein SAMN02787144_101680 [Streptomyces atratus]|uniref:Uncharacterized protein n=1 Tax=Streptomyces atratus TaxID=1893 RepID=A0A1K2E187_STRAR|nr:hypothetical protein SAMN02787144_101680 [Streptomyces atratus]
MVAESASLCSGRFGSGSGSARCRSRPTVPPSLHRLGCCVFGLAVGALPAAEAGSVLDALCDNLRSIEDFTDVHAAADLFRVI